MRTILISVLIIISTNALSQSIYDEFSLLNFQTKISFNNEVNDQFAGIDGTPYLSSKFVKGEITTSDGTVYKNIQMRFNAYNNIFEFLVKKTPYELNPQIIKEINLANHKYVYFTDTKGNNSAFYELLFEGKYSLLCKKSKELTKKDPGDGIRQPKPPKFVNKKDTYHILVGGVMHHVYNKKSLLKVFNKNAANIKKYIKTNKLSAKKAKDLIQIVKYASEKY